MTGPVLSTGDLWALVIAFMIWLAGLCVLAAVAEFRRAPLVDEHEQPIVHACPPDGSGSMPCCGRTPFEVPREERLTTYRPRVTCDGAR